MTTALLRRAASGVAIATAVAGLGVVPALTAVTTAPAVATDRTATTLSIKTVRSAVAPGASTKVTGVLRVRGQGGQPGHTVTLEAKPQGTDAFVPVAEAVTAERGGLRVIVTPSTPTRYRWHYAGDTETRGSVSGVARVGVRTPTHPPTRLNTTLAIRLSHRAVAPGGESVVRGRLATHRVAVQNRWVVLVSRTSGAEAWAFEEVAQTGPDGRVAFGVSPAERSAYRLAFLGTPLLQPVHSAVVHVAVRPTVTATAEPTVIDPGGTTTISGVVVTAAGPVVGAPVQLLARRVGSPQGLEVVGTGTTAADGTVAITATPLRSQFYRLRVLHSEGVPRALSPRVRVDVTAATSLSIRGRALAQSYVVSGVLRGGGHTLAGREVTVLALAPGATEWVAVGTATTGPHGKAKLAQPLAPGTAYQLSFAGGPKLAPCVSGTVVQ